MYVDRFFGITSVTWERWVNIQYVPFFHLENANNLSFCLRNCHRNVLEFFYVTFFHQLIEWLSCQVEYEFSFFSQIFVDHRPWRELNHTYFFRSGCSPQNREYISTSTNQEFGIEDCSRKHRFRDNVISSRSIWGIPVNNRLQSTMYNVYHDTIMLHTTRRNTRDMKHELCWHTYMGS